MINSKATQVSRKKSMQLVNLDDSEYRNDHERYPVKKEEGNRHQRICMHYHYHDL